MQTLKRKTRFNYHDYLLLPEEKRYEIIDGDLHMTPAPLTYHQSVSRNLFEYIWKYVKSNQLGEVFYAPVDVILSLEGIVQPDILYISKNRLKILTTENVQGPPDLIIEILSPSNKKRDQEIKFKLYERHGVREYWMVNPESKTIEVFQLTDEGYTLYRTFPQGTHLSSPLFSKIHLSIDQVF